MMIFSPMSFSSDTVLGMTTQSVVGFREAVLGVVQGDQGAADVLHGLRSTFPNDYERLVRHLYGKGPRGPGLFKRYQTQCDCDALVLGRDLLALMSEREGWSVDG